jgi:hypothetical protein
MAGGPSIDRHKIWRIVANNREQLNNLAPDGYEAVVEVTIIGGETMTVGRVETSRESDFPWTMLYSKMEHQAEKPQANDYFLFVRADHVQSVAIRLRRTGETPLGFAVAELDE